MGKPKKGKKSRQEDDFGDDDADVDPLAQLTEEKSEEAAPKPAGKKGKKGKKGRKDDDWEDDVATEIAALNLDDKGDDNITNGNGESNTQSKNKKKKKGKKVRMDISDDEEEDMKEEAEEDDIMALAKASSFIKPKKSKSGMSAFQMLAMDDDDDDDSQSEEEVEEVKPTQKKKDKNTKKQESIEDEDSDLDEVEEKPVPQTQPKQDKKKKKKEQNKPKKADEEDIDAVLAELEKPVEKEGKKKKKKKKGDDDEEHKDEGDKEESSGGLELKDMANMTQEEIAAMLWQDDEEEDDKKKRKKKKGKAAVKVEKEEDEDQAVLNEDKTEAEEDEEVSTVKTAAQKKKEKRERQKLQKQMEKEKGKKKDAVKKEDSMEAESESVPAESPAAEAPVEAEEKEEEEESSKKKKKDKKKKKTKEEKDAEEKAKKKPKSAHIKAMQEALQKMKEEEERLQQEEEEKEQRIEEARKAREEKEKIEKEKRERDKQKKKDKIAKQKAEGTYMTAKQREQQKRAQQMLEAMKAQGIEVPQAGSKEDGDKPKKRIVYDSRPRKKKNQQSRQGSEPPTPTSEELPKLETPSPKEEVEKKIEEVSKTEVKKEVKKEVDSWEEVADAWDQSDEEEKEEEEHMITEKTNSKDKPEKAEEIEEDEEEDEEDEEDGDEEEDSSDDESEEESSSEEEQEKLTPAEKIERIKEKVRTRIQKKHEAAEAKRTTDELRAPIVCVLGHVDTGKTKILDKLRKSNVQDGEAGGITQQIGATNVPEDAIKTQTKMCKDFAKKELNIPGLLIIDTPGHESFSNLRNRGSSLCDIAVLVVDIMHGLEPQTIESISLLKKRKTPFIVALNKVDRLFQWQSNPHSDIVNTIKKQKPNTKVEFDERAQQIIVQFAEQGLNVSLFYENKNPREYISMIPTSAISGDGMGNLIAVLCDLSQTMLAKRLSYSEELQAITMEVKAIPGLGTTIDVILVNGNLKEGQTVVLAGTEGPIVTQIRGLLMPQPLRELRVKSAYEKFKEIKAAQGVKIIAKDLDKALAGLPMYVAHQQDEILVYREEVEEALEHVLNSIKVVERGVFVQASTLGSMEALLEFLKTSKIPYAGINIGPIHRKDVMKASIMLEHDDQYAVILAFDVKVEREAQEMADSLGVRIFTADIIYHLFDQFMAYRDDLKHRKQEEFKHIAVFPCKLRVLPQYIFNSRDPIVIGVQIEAGFIKVGTPICVPSKGNVDLGRITSLELNHKSVEKAVKGQEVCIKIEPLPGDTPKLYGRHFEHTDFLYSKLTRESIDAVKNYFRDEMTKTDWQLVVEMKKLFQIL